MEFFRESSCGSANDGNINESDGAESGRDAGKNGLTRDTQRDATTDEVRRLKEENAALKTAVAETILDNQRLKKSLGL